MKKPHIARYLNEHNVMTSGSDTKKKGIKITCAIEKEKKLWSQTTISDMLKNEAYLGKTVWSKKRVAVTGKVPN